MSGRPQTPLKTRFHQKVIIDHATGCWLWSAAQGGHGYGQINVNGRPEKAHRIAYRMYVGEIPTGLSIDHLCRVRLCVNPEHLEAITLAENTRRQLAAAPHHNSAKTHCKRGHPLSGSNLRLVGYFRICRRCRAVITKRYRDKKKAAR